MRASYARQLIQKGVWTLQHVAGERMVADIGTKVLGGPRMTMLKEEMGMMSKEATSAEAHRGEEEEKPSEPNVPTRDEVQRALKIALMMAQLQAAKGQGEEEGDQRLKIEIGVVVILSLIGLLTMFGWLHHASPRPNLDTEELEEKKETREEKGSDEEE